MVIVGAGIGGLTAAGLLRRAGHEVELIERSAQFGDVGAGIQIAPNASRIIAATGLGDELATVGTVPERLVFRRWQDDSVLMATPAGRAHLQRYGHPYYNVFRPDLIEVLAKGIGGATVRMDAEVVSARNAPNGAVVKLATGEEVEGDLVVGADGIRSAVRAAVFGELPGRFSGWVAYRALVPRQRAPSLAVETTNRLGPGRHLVSYFVGRGQRYLNLVCVVPEPSWDIESWTEPGSLDDLRRFFSDWAPATQAILDAVQEPVYRWALFDRQPLARWTDERVTLLGDACHPMVPFLAQGAGMAIEDGAVLARCLEREPAVEDALRRYEQVRLPRTARLQAGSWKNCTVYHLPDGPEQRARDRSYQAASGSGAEALAAFDRVQGYDALTIDL